MSVPPAPALPHDDELQQIVSQCILESDAPGIGVLVSIDGHRASAWRGTACLKTGRALSERSRFDISCLMKFFVSLCVLELAAERHLDLTESVGERLPDWRALAKVSPALTLRHLMSHTGGYRGADVSDSRVRWNYSWDRLLEHLQLWGQSFPCGSVFNYEHTEHVVLGKVIGTICSQDPASVVASTVFERAGVALSNSRADRQRDDGTLVSQHTYSPPHRGFVVSEIPAFSPFWQLSLPDATLSLSDVAQVAETLLGCNRSRDASAIFSPQTLGAFQESVISLPPQVCSGLQAEQLPLGFTQACSEYPGGMLGHNGSTLGQTCALRIDAARRVVVVVGINAWLPHTRDDVVDRVFRLLDGRGMDRAEDETRPATFPFPAMGGGFEREDLPGLYVGSYAGEVRVSLEEGAVHFDLGRPGPRQRRITARSEREGWSITPAQTRACLGFFADPARPSQPALMMGLHAYRRCQS
jgi:CubicO group peptidase (beta-lactamase class C family)